MIESLYTRSAFYVLVGLLLVWLAAAGRYISANGGWLRLAWPNRWILVWALLLAAAAFLISPPTIKLLPDDGDQISISQNLYLRRSPAVILAARFASAADGRLEPEQQVLSERPLLFPTLVCLIHFARGYSWQNVFVANFLLLTACLTLLGIVGNRAAGAAGAVAQTLLAMAVPALTVWATSASYDLLSLTLLILILLLCSELVASRRPTTFAFLLATLLLHAHVRAENALFCCLVMALLALFGQLQRGLVRGSLWLAPAALLAAGLRGAQLYLTRQETLTSGEPSLSHFAANFGTAGFHFFLAFADTQQSQLLNWLALILATLFVRPLLAAANHQRLLLSLALAALATWGVVLFFQYGSLEIGYAPRYFLAWSLVLASAPMAVHLVRPRRLTRRSLVVTAVIASLIAVPRIVSTFKGTVTYGARYFSVMHNLIGENVEGARRILILSTPANICSVFTAVGYACNSRDWALAHKAEVAALLRSNPPAEVYVLDPPQNGSADGAVDPPWYPATDTFRFDWIYDRGPWPRRVWRLQLL